MTTVNLKTVPIEVLIQAIAARVGPDLDKQLLIYLGMASRCIEECSIEELRSANHTLAENRSDFVEVVGREILRRSS